MAESRQESVFLTAAVRNVAIGAGFKERLTSPDARV
ncbi:hypothetical protein ACP70R_009195 [Stipagrostis hirtigluma subsp. patula]